MAKTSFACLFALLLGAQTALAVTPRPQSACFGDPSWPVKIIYLHGWFSASGNVDVHGFRNLEDNNRKVLEQLANKLHERIAAPLAPSVNPKNNMQEWDGHSLAQVESGAEKACGVTSLPTGRTLLGFSSGGYEVNRIACLSRSNLSDYTQVVAIGMERGASCRNAKLTNISPHVFPPAVAKGTDSISHLAALTDQPVQPIQVAAVSKPIPTSAPSPAPTPVPAVPASTAAAAAWWARSVQPEVYNYPAEATQ